jgi:transcriptional regulator with XRE-family HTH domain
LSTLKGIYHPNLGNMQDIYEPIAKKITALRTDFGGKGLTQEELAAMLKTTANTISRWESQVYRPSVEDLHKMAKVFGVSISTFFPQMDISEKHHALMSATGELSSKDLEDLIEYAKFRKARTILEHAKQPRKKNSNA